MQQAARNDQERETCDAAHEVRQLEQRQTVWCSLSASVAVDVAGVAPETSSQPPATSVKAASNQGEIAAAARPSGAPTPKLKLVQDQQRRSRG